MSTEDTYPRVVGYVKNGDCPYRIVSLGKAAHLVEVLGTDGMGDQRWAAIDGDIARNVIRTWIGSRPATTDEPPK